MKTTLLREVTLYRYRYIVGYIAFGLLLFALLLLAIDQVPRGLSQAEMDSAVTSVNVNVFSPTTSDVIDAPYHILQKVSIQFLGLSPISLKLPSIIIGAITGVGIILMLQKWFRKNVAIITALLVVTSVGFLTLARTGTPMIMTAFWTVMLLLGATHFLHGQKHRFFWKLFCFVSVALLAYSPFGIYPLLALVLAGIFHPHVRYRLRQGKWWQQVILGACVLIILAPLIVAIIFNPSIGLQLLGIETIGELQAQYILPNALQAFRDMFDFTHNTAGTFTTPLYGIATTVLLLLGLLKLITARYSARSYMLFIWLILLIPVLMIRPDMVLLVIIPLTLVLAIGIETLIRQWYDIFPRNPYARIAALIPLTILMVSIVGINMERYFYGHHYSPLASNFYAELPAVRTALHNDNLGITRPVVIGVAPTQVGFYDLLRREYPKVSVVSSLHNARPPLLVLASSQQQYRGVPSRIITDDLSSDDQAVLLRVYNK